MKSKWNVPRCLAVIWFLSNDNFNSAYSQRGTHRCHWKMYISWTVDAPSHSEIIISSHKILCLPTYLEFLSIRICTGTRSLALRNTHATNLTERETVSRDVLHTLRKRQSRWWGHQTFFKLLRCGESQRCSGLKSIAPSHFHFHDNNNRVDTSITQRSIQ